MADDAAIQFGPVLLALLRERSWSQDDLADRMGRTKSQISGWCNGRKPQRSNLMDLARVFGLTLAQLEALAAGTEQPPSRPAPKLDDSPIFRVPLVNAISAGPVSESPELAGTTATHEDYVVAVGLDPAQRADYFALKVKGDSMSPRFEDGDIAICRWLNRYNGKDEPIAEGATVAVRFAPDAPAKLKRDAGLFCWGFDADLGTVVLTKANPTYASSRLLCTREDVENVAVAEVRQTRRC